MHTTSITPPSSWRSSGWRETSFIREENKVSSTSLQTPRPAHPSTRPPQSWPTLVPGQLLWACVTPYRILPAHVLLTLAFGILHSSRWILRHQTSHRLQRTQSSILPCTWRLQWPLAAPVKPDSQQAPSSLCQLLVPRAQMASATPGFQYPHMNTTTETSPHSSLLSPVSANSRSPRWQASQVPGFPGAPLQTQVWKFCIPQRISHNCDLTELWHVSHIASAE